MASGRYRGKNATAYGAAENRVHASGTMPESHYIVRRLGFSLFLFSSFLICSSCSSGSGPLTLKADMVRLMDIFPHFTIDQAPLKQAAAVDMSKVSEGEEVGGDIFRTYINHDFIKGSPVHPLKLKFTKNPSDGSPLGRQTKNIILAAPPTNLSLRVRLKRGYILRFEFAIIGEGWDDKDEEITFAILAEDLKSGDKETIYTNSLHPKDNPLDRNWRRDRVDLSAYRGKSIKLEFKTSVADSSLIGQAAAWVNPVLVAKDAEPRRPNIILISADTLRADHLGCYGCPRETTPAVDRLAGQSYRFERVISQAPYTVSSHMSIFTSLYPSFHKVNKVREDRLDSKILTLGEILYNSGYRTWAVTGGGQVSSSYGFSEGFESYLEFTSPEEDVRIKVAETIEFMDENRESPVFIFFHTYKPHPPYRPLPPYDTMFDPEYKGNIKGDIPTIDAINKGEITATRADIDHLTALYDGDIREMDDQLNELFTYLQQKGADKDTIIIFTSDHGEEFGEHGLYGVHSHTLYQELVYVPLIIHVPRMDPSGVSIPDQVRSIDIYPTILDLAGVKPPTNIQGRSLLSLMKTGKRSSAVEPAFSERIPGDSPWIRSLRTPDYSYMFKEDKKKGTNSHLFFDLRRDPTEQNNLGIPDSRLRALFNQILFLLEEGKKPGKTRGEQELDPETLEILRTLGYIR
jgi:arylsulfatase A-like enzyme